MRFSSCCVLVVCAIAALSCVALAEDVRESVVALKQSACPDALTKATFTVNSVQALNFTSVAPGDSFMLQVSGMISTNLTGGTYYMQVMRATDDYGGPVIAWQSASLDQIVVGAWPTKGYPTDLYLQWTLPASTPVVQADTQLQLRFEAVNQEEKLLTCLLVTLPVHATPEPTHKPADKKVLGYICAFISVIFFGTNFLPVKAYDTGDGVFFQWVLCVGVWMVGLVVQLIRQSAFEPLAMVGGMMWCLGNTLTVPIIQMIGLGVGMCIWGSATLIMGWASGRFGMLGIHPQRVENQAMNICGLLLCVASMGLMFQVKSVKEEKAAAAAAAGLDEGLLASEDDHGITHTLQTGGPLSDSQQRVYAMRQRHASESPVASSAEVAQEGGSWVDKLPPTTKRFLGIALSLVAGSLYGLNFNPPQYLIDSGKGSSSHGIDYVFSHFCGIFLTSTAYMIAYCILKKNRPQVSNQIVLPGLLSGIAWAVAQTSWFIANDQIHFVGTFPIVSCGPGIVATLCAILIYKEIQGRKNYLFLTATAVVTGAGVLLIAFSLPSGA